VDLVRQVVKANAAILNRYRYEFRNGFLRNSKILFLLNCDGDSLRDLSKARVVKSENINVLLD